jgi:hypothetical protein
LIANSNGKQILRCAKDDNTYEDDDSIEQLKGAGVMAFRGL